MGVSRLMGGGTPPNGQNTPPLPFGGTPPLGGGIPPPTQNTPNLAIISLKGCLPCLYRAKGGFRLMDPKKVTFSLEKCGKTPMFWGTPLRLPKTGVSPPERGDPPRGGDPPP